MKITRFFKRIVLVLKTNKRTKSKISYRSNIDEHSEFCGLNVIARNVTISRSRVGKATYISHNVFFANTTIGAYCSIAPYVKLIAGNHPTRKFVSTSPLFYNNNQIAGLSLGSANNFEEYSYTNHEKGIMSEIGNDVWIGEDTSIMAGVKIGDGAVVGARSLVTKDVPAYAIVVGVPARIIRYRFDAQQIELLERIKWWDWEIDEIKKSVEYFGDIEDFLNNFSNGKY